MSNYEDDFDKGLPSPYSTLMESIHKSIVVFCKTDLSLAFSTLGRHFSKDMSLREIAFHSYRKARCTAKEDNTWKLNFANQANTSVRYCAASAKTTILENAD